MPNEEEGEEREVRKPKKKHTRRAFLKYATKVGLGAALWGVGGHYLGKAFNYTVKPVIKEGLIVYQRGGRNLRRFGVLPPVQESRRGFLKRLLIKGYQHPVAAGTLIGTTYGLGKYSIGGLGKYLNQRQIAVLKDENADYRERLDALEQYKTRAEKDLKGKEDKITELEENVNGLRRQIARSGKLEETAGEAPLLEEGEETLLAFGISGLLVSMGLSSSIMTGNAISGIQSNYLLPLSAIIFVLSLVFVLFGLKRKNKRRKR
ncbi:MAG: hypothetical protein AABX50_01715 [Nanoarchaeota archaeon]